jgi:cystathionine beta-lyase family protein involved in aluminum resistance
MRLSISNNVYKLAENAIRDTTGQFKTIDDIAQINTEKVLAAFQRYRVSETCFAGTTGYGYNDKGRDTLDEIFAYVMGTQTALVRVGFVSGTHAITAALFAALRPGQTLVSATGLPYDTLKSVIGITGKFSGSLKEYGIGYAQVERCKDGAPDHKAIAAAARDKTVGAVYAQRSRGYSPQRALTVREIGDICKTVHNVNANLIVIVDNCYGEFTEIYEPGDLGADLVAGSLIKNPGGGLATAGGYVAGREALVEAAAFRLTSPGIGAECGATLGINRLLYQGLFMAPHTVAQAMKTAVFCARLLELLGYKTSPAFYEARSDIIQMVEFGSQELLEHFCKGIQAGAPVDSFVTPEAWDMPGYDHPVIMAAGGFIQGASIELSADGPMREPYSAYIQGGLTFESAKLGIMLAASYLENTVLHRVN